MLMLSKKDILKCYSVTDAIDACRDALALYAEGKVQVPLRTNISVPDAEGISLFMPAYVAGLNALGIKIVSVFPKNSEQNKPAVLSQMILQDANTGEVCAVIDGTYLTQLRTGGLQGIATQLLARPDAKIGLLIGTGGQAEMQLRAMLHVRPLSEIYIAGRDINKTIQFVNDHQIFADPYNTKLIAIADANEVVANADIITAITTSTTPIFDGNLVKKGAHVNGMGAFTKEMLEIPAALMQRANGIAMDTKTGVLAEAGDVIAALESGLVNENACVEFGDIILGKVKGRSHPSDITFFKSVGTAVVDAVTAARIYEKAIANNIGNEVKI